MLSVTVMIFRDMVESVMLLNEDDCKIQQKILKVLNGSEWDNKNNYWALIHWELIKRFPFGRHPETIVASSKLFLI